MLVEIAALFAISALYLWCLVGRPLFVEGVNLRASDEERDPLFLRASPVVPTFNDARIEPITDR
jgi:hypothetical protein